MTGRLTQSRYLYKPSTKARKTTKKGTNCLKKNNR